MSGTNSFSDTDTLIYRWSQVTPDRKEIYFGFLRIVIQSTRFISLTSSFFIRFSFIYAYYFYSFEENN